MADQAPVIDVNGLSKAFSGKTVVNSLSLKVPPGTICGFLGPNGSGKTTFIRMLCGLLRPDAGQGTCLGYDLLSEAEHIKPQIGYMAQHFSLYTDLSVRENLDFMARIYGLDKPRQKVDAMLERLELGRFSRQLAGTLSGGWQQRLALAGCLLHRPKLLLLDEPTAGVDPKARRDFWDQVYLLAGEGISSLISTHYMDEAERCHQLVYLAYGDLLAAGTAEKLVEEAGLSTWAVTGPELHELGEQLKSLPGVSQLVPFGNSLHISGKDEELLASSLQPFRGQQEYRWQQVETSLEEVFIHLMQGREET